MIYPFCFLTVSQRGRKDGEEARKGAREPIIQRHYPCVLPERLKPPQVPIDQSSNLARGHAPAVGLEAVPVEVVVPDLGGVVEQTLVLA